MFLPKSAIGDTFSFLVLNRCVVQVSLKQNDLFSSQIATEGLRLDISPGISNHMAKFIRICMNEDPGKRPSFEQVLPILDKMRK